MIKRLQNDGYTVIAPANPLRSVSSDSAYIASVLDTIDGPIILVGHSYGGMVTQRGCAHHEQVHPGTGLCRRIHPRSGRERSSTGQSHRAGRARCEQARAATWYARCSRHITTRPFPPFGQIDADLYLNADTFRANFAADVPEAKTRLMAVTQRPLSLQAFTEPSAAAAWKNIPSWSLVAMQDNAIGWANTSFMAERTVTEGKGHVTKINASHAVMVSHPRCR